LLGAVRLVAYGVAGPLVVVVFLVAFSGGGQEVVYSGECQFNLTREGPVYYWRVLLDAAVPAWVEVRPTVFAPPGSVEVELAGERLVPPARFSLGPGEQAVLVVYCSPEAAGLEPRAPLVVVEAGVEAWFSALLAVAGLAVAGVVVRGL